MVQFSSSYRSKEVEIMDEFDLQGDEMKVLLTDLKKVNTLLGGFHITIEGIEKLLKNFKKDSITIVDFGCGDGEMLRKCAKHFKRKNIEFKFIGIDANPYILKEAESRSQMFNNIEFVTVDVFKNSEKIPTFDIGLFTLFLHHFSEDKIIELLNHLSAKANLGFVVNDLRRSSVAFTLFKGFSAFFLKTKTARHDGLVSIARGFKKNDIDKMGSKIPFNHFSSKKWAFRYQWIINKI